MSYNEFKKRKVSKVFDPDHNPSAEQIVKLLVGEDCIKCKPDAIRDKIQVYHAPCPKIKGKRLVWRKGAGWLNPLSMLQTSYGGKNGGKELMIDAYYEAYDATNAASMAWIFER